MGRAAGIFITVDGNQGVGIASLEISIVLRHMFEKQLVNGEIAMFVSL